MASCQGACILVLGASGQASCWALKEVPEAWDPCCHAGVAFRHQACTGRASCLDFHCKEASCLEGTGQVVRACLGARNESSACCVQATVPQLNEVAYCLGVAYYLVGVAYCLVGVAYYLDEVAYYLDEVVFGPDVEAYCMDEEAYSLDAEIAESYCQVEVACCLVAAAYHFDEEEHHSVEGAFHLRH